MFDDEEPDLPMVDFASQEPTLRLDSTVRACCLKCNSEFVVSDFSFVCRYCGSSNFSVQKTAGESRKDKNGSSSLG